MDRKRTYRKPKVCIVCGVPIPSTKKRYCSEECRKKARIIQQRNDRRAAKELGIPYDELIGGKYEID